ncbi:unnamed protein product [Trifolium pratense]|uniref:Uncharacterized protein n=1 Tax=Trifolium pratense TaxID=57577 RepID=A0ACB0L9B2_TRIPR|nr:unnamed protein product [Trifolium pratense]
MVVDIFSENCGVVAMSPRISFSHDFSQQGVIPIEKHPLRSNSSGLNSSMDFDFCVNENSELESSSADELFSDGIILPTEIKKKKNIPLKQTPIQPTIPQNYALPPLYANGSKNSKKMSTKDVKELNINDEVDEKHNSNSNKSFWGFKRSSSCGSGYARSLCPLPLLSKSNSTGSSTSVKGVQISKEGSNVKQNSKKNSSTTRSSHSIGSNNQQKPPLKRSYGNSVRVTPVLNVPYSNLFGFASIFSNNRNKSKKK